MHDVIFQFLLSLSPFTVNIYLYGWQPRRPAASLWSFKAGFLILSLHKKNTALCSFFRRYAEKPGLKQSDSYPAPLNSNLATEMHALAYTAQAQTTQHWRTVRIWQANNLILILILASKRWGLSAKMKHHNRWSCEAVTCFYLSLHLAVWGSGVRRKGLVGRGRPLPCRLRQQRKH